MFTRRVAAVAVSITVLTFSLAIAFQDAPAKATRYGEIDLEPCGSSRIGALCGTYEVWENRETEQGRKISLNIKVIPASGDSKKMDPIVPIAGGPGQAVVGLGGFYRSSYRTARETRDIVLIDQRGTGKSNGLMMDIDIFFHSEENNAKFEEEKARLSEFADISQYHSINAAHDLAEVCKALGYKQLNLAGGSYGTRMSWVFSQLYPEMVRTMTLKAVMDPERPGGLEMPFDSQASLDGVIKRCEADEACSTAFPNLSIKLDEILARLEETPINMKQGERDVDVDHIVFANTVHWFLFAPETITMIPYYIDSMHKGDTAILSQALGAVDGITNSLYIGMMMSVLRHEDLPRFDEELAEKYARDSYLTPSDNELVGLALTWPTSMEIPAEFWKLKNSGIPVLFVSGRLDPVTPPRYADKLAEFYSDSAHIVIENASHAETHFSHVYPLMNKFIETGTTKGLVTGEIDQPATLPFLTGG